MELSDSELAGVKSYREYLACDLLRYLQDTLPRRSMQIFSIKVTDLRYGLIWPLQIYGSVAFRNSIGHKANYLFRCTRDSFQTITQKV
uniref:DUF6598 domain-containing protein n=1 Tax=Aegilops tauschii subsp. strangulata TaxID=200361 RepID=A0A453CNN3_AEGTS